MPAPNWPGVVISGVPEFGPTAKRSLPTSNRPSGLEKVAIATRPMVRARPFEKPPVITPSPPTEKLVSVPRGVPSWKTAASVESCAVLELVSEVTLLPAEVKKRSTPRGSTAPVPARPICTVAGAVVDRRPKLSKLIVPVAIERTGMMGGPGTRLSSDST